VSVQRSEREMILTEDVVKPETPRQRLQLEGLAEDLRSSPLRGKRLRLRLRNFRPATDGYLAAVGGPLPYMVRLRTIAEMTEEHEARLRDAWRSLAAASADGAAFAAAWRAEVERWPFDEVNDLIERHNLYYPAESRLPMDPRTRTYVLVNGEDYRRRPLDSAWALERFPADLDLARG
jgi:hypothetical protein